jgi:hypothetical protein
MYKLIEYRQEKKREYICMITLRPVDLGQRVIYERREKEKRKDSYCTIGQYTIVFKVIELVRSNYLHLHVLLKRHNQQQQ